MSKKKPFTNEEYIESAKMIEDHLNRLKIKTHGAGGPLDGPELSLYGRFNAAMSVNTDLLAAVEILTQALIDGGQSAGTRSLIEMGEAAIKKAKGEKS